MNKIERSFRIGTATLITIVTAGCFRAPKSVNVAETPTPITATFTPDAGTDTQKTPTSAPVEFLPRATETLKAPEFLVAKTPDIKAGLSEATTSFAEHLDTPEYGIRSTYTSRSFLFPDIPWNQELNKEQLEIVEQTWQTVQVSVPQGSTARLFSGGFKQGDYQIEDGVLLTLNPGVYDFQMRNGEITIRPDDQKDFADKDLERIIDQIRNGNFDIDNPLVLARVTPDLLSSIPKDIVTSNGTEIMPSPEKSTE
ncbi:MAG: hypothetical protein PHR98_02810 [Candidatus Shapirobacteria bacterium]|nr:hypothetical protein [Candidatus Shapirobacteria bacterium]